MAMRIGATAVVAALLVLAGCGGGGGGERLSHDEYVAKADAICAALVKEQKTLPSPSSIAEIPGYVDQALPMVDSALARIRALRPPKELEEGVGRWLAATAETRDQLAKLRAAAAKGDQAEVNTVAAKGTDLDSSRDAIAREIGLTTCANT